MENSSEIGSVIVVGSIVVIILATFSLLFFFVLLSKKKKLDLEKELMQASYDKAILQSQLEIQEQTFTTISQEIHDNVGQILSLVKVQLNIMDESEVIDRPLLHDAQENISKAMTDLRDIAKGLSSELIRVVGLISTVEQEVQRINRSGITNSKVSVSGKEHILDSQKQLILFRVIQECLQNIIKHAAASTVMIRFIFSEDDLCITVTDNGKGFNFQQAQPMHHGLGLQNIFKRVEMIGGNVEVNSVMQTGTTIQITIPYE